MSSDSRLAFINAEKIAEISSLLHYQSPAETSGDEPDKEDVDLKQSPNTQNWDLLIFKLALHLDPVNHFLQLCKVISFILHSVYTPYSLL